MKVGFSDTILNLQEDSEVPNIDSYEKVFEGALINGYLPDMPELEVFGVGKVDIEAIREFSLSLVNFIEKKEQGADEEELGLLYHFGKSIHLEFFSASPSLINFIGLTDRLKLMTRATRSKVVQETFGSVFVGETVYDVSFMKGRLDEVAISAMEDLSIPERLDLLHQLRTVGAQAIANGVWSRSAYNQVCQTYESLINSENSSVFVQLAAEAGLEALDAEYENPQLGFTRFEGQTSDSRLHTRFSSEEVEALTDKFFSKFSLDHVVPNATMILPATRDALVCMDESGLATGIIRIDVENFLSSPASDSGFDVNQYRIYKQHLGASLGFENEKRDQITVSVYHAIYDEYVNEFVAAGDAEGAAKLFAQMLPVLSYEEWLAYFFGEIKQHEFPSQNAFYQEALNENSKASQEHIVRLFTYREQLGDLYEEDYIELGAALEHEDFEYALEIATNITSRCRYEQNSNAIHQEVAGLQRKVTEIHQANFERAKEKYEASMTELAQIEEIRVRTEAVFKLEQNLDRLGSELRTFIESKLLSAEDLPQLHITTLKELIYELRGGDGLRAVTDEDVLLFQHVHSGELAIKIEEKFGFALSDLSLKEQYFFLNYLKEVTPFSCELIQRFTFSYGVDGMRTFLSLERGTEDLANKIVAFGQHEEVAKKVFGYYGELLDIANRAEELVKEKTSCEGEVCVQLAGQVRENILNRAQKDLERAVRADDVGSIESLFGTYVAEAKEYVAILQELGIQQAERVRSSELSDEDQVRMMALLEQNYNASYQGVENEVFRDTIKDSLKKSFANLHTEFHILRDKDEIISFNRFDVTQNENEQSVSYFGSFNADPTYSGVGSVMLERTIQEQLDKCDVMYAHCDPTSEISKKYIESGFVAKDTETVAGKFSFEIWRTKDIAEHLSSKRMTVEDLMRGDFQEDSIIVREVTKDDAFEELDEDLGYLLTRYFKHDDGKTYVVFEIPSPTLWNQFQA